MKSNKIWLTSDWHFGHDKDFVYEPRGLKSMEENTQTIIINHNAIVYDNDDVYVLGDLMLGDTDYGITQVLQMKGKLHIVLGNHDSETRIERYKELPNVTEICYATMLKYAKNNFYLSHYPTITANYDDNKPWHKNLINLYGHTHQKTNFWGEKNPYMYHVGVDSHDCYPVLLDDIIEEIRQKKIDIGNDKNRIHDLMDLI